MFDLFSIPYERGIGEAYANITPSGDKAFERGTFYFGWRDAQKPQNSWQSLRLHSFVFPT